MSLPHFVSFIETPELSKWRDVVADFEESCKSEGVYPGPWCSATCSIQVLSCLTLLVIGCLAATGVLSPTVVAGCAIGLGAVYLISALAQGHLKERAGTVALAILFGATMVVLGGLNLGGVLVASQLASGILGAYGVALFLSCCCTSLINNSVRTAFPIASDDL